MQQIKIFAWNLYLEYIYPNRYTNNWFRTVRSRQRLIRARNILRNLQNEIEIFYQNAKLTPDMIGLRNGLQTANAIIAATMEARLSLGAHYLLEDTE